MVLISKWSLSEDLLYSKQLVCDTGQILDTDAVFGTWTIKLSFSLRRLHFHSSQIRLRKQHQHLVAIPNRLNAALNMSMFLTSFSVNCSSLGGSTAHANNWPPFTPSTNASTMTTDILIISHLKWQKSYGLKKRENKALWCHTFTVCNISQVHWKYGSYYVLVFANKKFHLFIYF